jgi:rod shape determining protein RodA
MPLLWNLLHPYQKKRVLTFLNPESDPLGAGYNIIQSKVAIGSGGMFGKGFMQGTQSQLSFLPEKQTDFIFTVIAEEYGLIGASLVLLIFVIMVAYCMKMAAFSRQQFTRLIISGFAFMLTLHVFINIGMISGMIPAVGIPLPFLSYGGSNLVAMCSCIGLVVNCIVYDKVNCQ